jgi:5-methylcytosine-specific restriction endonuclease McrA
MSSSEGLIWFWEQQQSGQMLPDGEQRSERAAQKQDASQLCELRRNDSNEIEQRSDKRSDDGDSHMHGDTPGDILAAEKWIAQRARRKEREAQEKQRDEEQRQARRDLYAAYLRTDQWQSIRKRVMARANGRCEGCGMVEPREVHHLTYAHRGNEFLFELVALCEACHLRITAGEKARRAR